MKRKLLSSLHFATPGLLVMIGVLIGASASAAELLKNGNFDAAPLGPTKGTALDFLSDVPEFRQFDLKMTEERLKELINQNHLLVKLFSDKEGDKSYRVFRGDGENVIVMFRGGGCSGIQRMRRDAEAVEKLHDSGPVQASAPAQPSAGWTELKKAVQRLIAGQPARTGFDFEIWEKVAGTASEYRIRPDVKQFELKPGELKPGDGWLPMGTAYFLTASNRFYIQWDSPAASTLHYYGPFEADPVINLSRLQLPRETVLPAERFGIPNLSGDQRAAVIAEAIKAAGGFVRLNPKEREGNNIPKQFWGDTIQGLKPQRVMYDRVNIKIVLAEGSGVESGLYVTHPYSSFAPQPKDHLEFVRVSQPEDKAFGELYRYKLVQTSASK